MSVDVRTGAAALRRSPVSRGASSPRSVDSGPESPVPGVEATSLTLHPERARAASRPDDVPFEDVVASARAGAEWAWQAIYTELAPAVLGYLRGQGAPNPDDLVSEIFLQVVRDLDRFQGTEAKFRSWVFAIAHHRLIDARRYEQRRPVVPADAEVIHDALPTEQDASDIALDNLTTNEIKALTEALTPDQRAAMLLRLVGGLTLSEIAAVMGKRANAVKQLQRRAIHSLREQLVSPAYPQDREATLTQLR